MNIYLRSTGFSALSALDPVSFSWSIADSTIATVNQNGLIQLKSPGNTTVTATLKSNPSVTLTVDLNAYMDLSDSKETEIYSATDFDYTGSPITPSPTVIFHDRTLTEGVDYTISYSNNQNAGDASFTVEGAGLYKGSKTVFFTIEQAYLTDATVTVPESSYIYKGVPIEPKPTVVWNGQTLVEGKDYTLSYVDNDHQGNACVIATDCGNFRSFRGAYFYITTTPITDAVIGDIPDYDYTGQECRPEPTVTLNDVLLRKDIDYVLSYSSNVKTSSRNNTPRVNITGIGLYGSYAHKDFVIKPVTVSGETIRLDNGNCGSENPFTFLKNNLVVTFKGTQLPSTALDISSVLRTSDNEILSFTLSYTENYTGQSRNIYTVKICNFSTISDQTYTSSPITPAFTIKYGSYTLQEGTDYTLSLKNNIEPGTASVTVTGLQNYFGSTTLNFQIMKPQPTATPTPTPAKPTSTPTPAPAKLTTPPVLQATTLWNKVTIRWTPVSNAKNYTLYKKTGSGKYKKLKTLNANSSSYQDKKVAVGTTYQYKVQATLKTAGASSLTSNTVKVRPALSRPNLSLKTDRDKQTLFWKKVSGASGYILYQQTGKGKFKKIKTFSAKITRYTLRTKKGVTYSYKLVPYRTVNKKAKTGTASLIKTGKAK